MTDSTTNIETPTQEAKRSQGSSAPAYATRRKLFAAAVVLQVALLLGLAYQPMNTLASGSVVTFQTVPVDPWDMFRGDYVVLSYPFSSIKTSDAFADGQRVYTVLGKNSAGEWQAKRVITEVPALEPDEIILAGKVESSTDGSVRVRYGIEQVFVAEGRGRNVNSGVSVEADVAVDAEGRAVIKEVRNKDDVLYRWRLM